VLEVGAGSCPEAPVAIIKITYSEMLSEGCEHRSMDGPVSLGPVFIFYRHFWDKDKSLHRFFDFL